MGFGYAYDPPGRICSGGPTPGIGALGSIVRARFTVTDAGVYACRPVRVAGSTTLSFHGEGRAADYGCTRAVGDELAAWLVANADGLGVQEVIWWRRRWTSQGIRTWVPYHGDDPHESHVHVALCRAAAAARSLEVGSVPPEGGSSGPGGAIPGAELLTDSSTWARVAGVLLGLVLVALAVVLMVRDLRRRVLHA